MYDEKDLPRYVVLLRVKTQRQWESGDNSCVEANSSGCWPCWYGLYLSNPFVNCSHCHVIVFHLIFVSLLEGKIKVLMKIIGVSGFFVGAVSGILRSTTPFLFAMASGIQWSALGGTFWGEPAISRRVIR
jgi:hypothetical protein